MAIAVDFYSFSKKQNSTKRPSTGAVPFNMELKAPTSALNPTVLIAARDMPVPTVAPTNYNYAHIGAFQRYYWVTDWVYNAGIWEASLAVDVLASWKTGIGSLSCYIERSASHYNGNIMDTMYPAKTDFSITHVSVNNTWYNIAPSGGTYVLGVINYQSSNNVGAVTYYACTQANLSAVLNYLFGNSIYNASNIPEMSQGLYSSFFNPFQYIVSCIWFPFVSEAFGSASTDIKVGYWSTGVQAVMVSDLAQKTYITATIPNHPQASRGNYLNHAPYTKLTLYLPPFGSIPIDTRFTEIGNYLYCSCYIDHITGEATLRVNIAPSSGDLQENKYITERSAVIGVPIQLAQVMNEYSKSPTGFLGDVLAEGILSILGQSVGSSINCSTPTVTTSGSNGSFVNFIMPAGLIVEHAKLVDEDLADFGRPLMTTKTINTLTGYIKAIEPHLELPITEAESIKIKELMESGFFYE